MLNLTRQERLVIQFLVAFFLIGGAIHLYKANFVKVEIVNADKVDKEKEHFKVMADRVDSIYFASRSKATQKNDEKISKPDSYRININTATKDELMKIPKIGPVTAERIILYRMENGRFNSVEELIKVKGIGKKTIERIRGEVTIE
ncbi:MAG: helix-hairpin-helix domain-containing protein [Candidatus Marinimicrobia bacterium]|nr:helix-hairpin-helix domain-containing protein [Candidatus Neomarinimicrobiota bacterium]